MSCPSLTFVSKRGPKGWRTTIRATGLAPVVVDAGDKKTAETTAYAHLQLLADESEARGNPLNLDDYAVHLELDPAEVLQ